MLVHHSCATAKAQGLAFVYQQHADTALHYAQKCFPWFRGCTITFTHRNLLVTFAELRCQRGHRPAVAGFPADAAQRRFEGLDLASEFVDLTAALCCELLLGFQRRLCCCKFCQRILQKVGKSSSTPVAVVRTTL